jgi:glycosyltransferase involved in cell wall biosynthesis
MKIAVYTIALNEEKFVERWYESAKDADYLLIADTGSTDKTVKIAKKLGINVIQISVKPWRFDDSRNAALAALPDDIDYCVSMDMDETLSEGWREKLEKMTGDVIQYKLNTSYKDEDEKHPDEYFINSRIHKRHGFRWHYFIHETIFADRFTPTYEFCEGLEVSHHPDTEKPRSQYDPMIEAAYKEYKNSRYNIYYFYMVRNLGDKKEAIRVLKELAKLEDVTKLDKALAYAILATMKKRFKAVGLIKSLFVYPTREAYTQLAILYYQKEKWLRAYFFAKKADDTKIITQSMLKDHYVWGYLPVNLKLAAKYNLKLFKYSKSYKQKKREVNLQSYISHKFKLFQD